ncbi:MAG: histidine kinase [Lewinellaceae bacterium]|nr:histidine kinase [Lewinellaceae bacterium]
MTTFGVWLLLPFAPCAQYPFENPLTLDAANGLPTNRITDLAVDDDGVAWMGADMGLVRFDGLTIETYQHNPDNPASLLTNQVNALLPDSRNGVVWVGTPAGISVFDISKKQFRNYPANDQDPHGVPDNQVECMFKDRDGQIWAGLRDKGLIRYRPATDDFQQFLCHDTASFANGKNCLSVNGIKADLENDSILWLSGTGVTRFNRMDGSFDHYAFQSADERERRYINGNNCLMVCSNGKIYLGTWFHGVYVFDINSRRFSPLDPCFENNIKPYSRETVHSFYQKNNNEFWINTQRGLLLYDIQKGCITHSFENDVVKKRWFAVDFIDRQGRIWSFHPRAGLRIYNPMMQQYEFSFYEEGDSPYDSFISRILEDTASGRLYVATPGFSKGFHFLDKNKNWHCIPPPLGHLSGEVESINISDIAMLPNGEVLVVGVEKLFWYRPGAKRLEEYPVQPKEPVLRFRAAMQDSEGNIWLGGWSGGFFRLNPKTRELHSFRDALKACSDHPLGGDRMAEDKNGNIWMRENDGLLILEKATGKFIYHPHDPNGRKSLRGMGRMEPDSDGRVWIATNKEFLGYGHADSLDRGIIRLFGWKDGLVGSHVYKVKKYRDQLMIFTEKGMQLFDPKSLKFGQFYDAGYGLGGSVLAITFLSDGRAAVGRPKALAYFHPDGLATNAELPVPYVTAFRVFDDIYQINNGPGRTDTVVLSYRQNFFSFEFSAVGYNLPERTRFRYMLEGFDEKWQDGTQRRFAAYTNVPGGDYRFLVEAINSEGLSLGKPSVTHLHISTVWYKKAWAWALVAASLLGFGYLVYRYRIGQVRKEERLKSEYERKLADVEMSALRAQMNPHFIFNSLNSIEYYIISNEPEKASDYLNRFSRLIRLILQNSKSTAVPLKDDIEALKLYIEMESMRFDNLFDYEVKMESGLDMEHTLVPPMLLQPYVENAIWHGLLQKKGEKGRLDLTLRKNNGHLICLIEDNGIGRDAAQQLKSKSANKRKSFGMKITSDRLAMLNKLAGANASVNIFDLKNKNGTAAGTRVELVIPL